LTRGLGAQGITGVAISGYGYGKTFCRECEMEAIERLDAVSNGSVVLSVNEDLPHRGQTAIYRSTSDGLLEMETWKTCAGGEAECVLAI